MKHLRIVAAALCALLLLTLAACRTKVNPTHPTDSTGSEEPAAPPTDEELFLEALDAYGTYFNHSDVFDAKFPTIGDFRGTTESTLTLSELSVFGESMGDLANASKPFLQMAGTFTGDLISYAYTLSPFGETLHAIGYLSESGFIAEYPDLIGQKPIRLTAEDASDLTNGVTDPRSAFEKLLESLEEPGALTVTEDGETRIYTLELDEKALKRLFKDMGLEDAAEIDEGDSMSFRLTAVNGLPTDLRISLYDEENAPAVQEFILTTSAEGNITSYGFTLLSEGETLLTLDGKTTTAEGSVTVEASLKLHTPETEEEPAEGGFALQGDLQFDLNVKLLQQSDGSINLDGTIELRLNMEGGAAFIVPINITGTCTGKGNKLDAYSVEISTSGAGMFSIAMRYESTFTEGTPSVTLPSGAVDAEDVDSEAFTAALQEAYPLTMQAIAGMASGLPGGMGFDSKSYLSEDAEVSATVYADDTIEITAYTAFTDSGESLTFYYNNKTFGPYIYTENADCSVTAYGMQFALDPDAEDYGCDKILFYNSEDGLTGVDLEFYPDGVLVYFCLPFETTDGKTQVFLPDGTALPFDVILPEDDTSPLRIGSLTLLPYEIMDLV